MADSEIHELRQLIGELGKVLNEVCMRLGKVEKRLDRIEKVVVEGFKDLAESIDTIEGASDPSGSKINTLSD